MLTDPYFYLMAVPAVLIAGVAKGGFGSSFSMAAVPIMSLAVAPPQAAAIMLPLLCFMDLFGAWAYRGKWDRKNIKILLPATVVGIALGTVAFRSLDVTMFRLLVGSIAVIFTLNYWFNWAQRERPPQPASWIRGGFWGALSGFVSFIGHAGGPPVIVYLLPQRLEKTVYHATTVIFFLIGNYVKLIPYTLLGQLNPGNLTTSLVLAPVVPIAMITGIYLHTRVSAAVFYRICYAVLFVTGLKLLADGFQSLLG